MTSRLGEVPDYVSLRAHRGGVPATPASVVHGEAVMVFGNGHDEVGSRLTEQLRPLGRVEGIRGELWDEVLVAELVLRTVRGPVVLELRPALLVHPARVPLVAECGDGVNAPVNEDAELGVAVPAWRLIGRQ